MTPQELLKEVKEYFRYVPDVKTESSETFYKMTIEAIAKLNVPEDENVKFDIENDYIVEALSKDILNVLDEKESEDIRKNIAFGKIYNTTVNAMCIEENGSYVIVVNEGLLLLLHKYGKLNVASIEPENVIFCNRGDVKSIDSQTYRIWANELIENYKKYSTPLGAMIKLNEKGNISHSITLDLEELFVICHELGHYLNGDLSKKENLINLINTSWNVYNENKNHEIEYKADLTGFDIFCKVAKKKYGLEKNQLVLYVAILFDILHMITPEATESHPNAIDRTYNIIKYNYNEKLAEDYLNTYNKKLALKDFFNSLNINN